MKDTQHLSRQRLWQIANKAAGKCIYCTDPLFTESCCERHTIARRERQRKRTGHQPWKPGSRGRRPIEATETTNQTKPTSK